MNPPTTADRWHDWLHRAKERAALMENLTPLADDRPRRSRATSEPATGSPESWYEPSPWKSPVQDAPNLVTLDPWAVVSRKIQVSKLRKQKRKVA